MKEIAGFSGTKRESHGMRNVTYRVIEHGSREYQEIVALRYRVLREPLGLDFTPEQLAAEAEDTLIAAFAGEQIIGSLILTARTAAAVQMRQVAVAPQWQGQGVGRGLVAFCEAEAIRQGYQKIVLHSRETAVPFYERLGYEICSEPFTEIGLPHREMRKALTAV